MPSQTPPKTRSPASITQNIPIQSASHSSTQRPTPPPSTPNSQSLDETIICSRPRPAHTQSAPTLSAHSPSPANARNYRHSNSQDASVSGQPILSRGYTAHLPHNPNRPPPYTYQRQHEFPPFPPLAQHPVLPFLTTAFSNQPDTRPVVPPAPKAKQTIAPRTSTTQRHVHSNLSTIPTLDVSKNDPTATFIRPPLVVPLPRNSEPNIRPAMLRGIPTDGEPAPGTPLTYAILHHHRNWFLDADDFRKDNPNRIDYPPDLEPPRGWAPLAECTGPGAANRCKQAKETKERTNALRTKGSYAHADSSPIDNSVEYGPSDDCHEKTVLRCTFCRREYHGPNAKSMWRRHVYDKHKVAMKNRREGSAGMAPRVSLTKKGKTKAAGSVPCPLTALDTPALTLDLTNEQNLIRLLERVVSGNLDINLPASILSSSPNGGIPGINIQSIALALQRSGISVALEKGGKKSSDPDSSDSSDVGNCSGADKQRDRDRTDLGMLDRPADSMFNATEDERSSPPSNAIAESVAQAIWAPESSQSTSPKIPNRQLTKPSSFISTSQSDDASYGQKRKTEGDGDEHAHASTIWNRPPLKDNTAMDRNSHNLNMRVIPGTPRKDRGKQKALPQTPNGPKMSQDISPPSPRNPYTPQRHPSKTALRARALATTGEESYLTLVLSSPSASPIRSAGRVSFTSPFYRRMSPMKIKGRDVPSTGEDAFGVSSPRYPFDFNIEGTEDSPSYMSAFDPIPLELGSMTPAHWTPPSLGPPAPVSEPTSRSLSRASSIGVDIAADEADNVDQDMALRYPEWSSPTHIPRHRSSHSPRSHDDDFDMDAFLDLEDAEPASPSGHNYPVSPHKIVVGRGFAKEFGLLSPEEVERITTSAHCTFEDEARSSKRRRVDHSP